MSELLITYKFMGGEMSIQVTFRNEEGEFITQGTLEIVPRIGETIWFVPNGTHKACTVTDVCYWIATDPHNNYQNACVYLKENNSPQT